MEIAPDGDSVKAVSSSSSASSSSYASSSTRGVKEREAAAKYEDEEEEEEDVCRICRNPGDRENPLRYPCACSGSIKYVHQDCLLQWLNHSNARQCEVSLFLSLIGLNFVNLNCFGYFCSNFVKIGGFMFWYVLILVV